MSTLYACGCGEWAGERCCWEGPLSEMAVVEYMPACHRDSHTAARNSGSWPHNGAVRVACHRECADRVVEADGPEWAGVVAADPADYAEEAHPDADLPAGHGQHPAGRGRTEAAEARTPLTTRPRTA